MKFKVTEVQGYKRIQGNGRQDWQEAYWVKLLQGVRDLGQLGNTKDGQKTQWIFRALTLRGDDAERIQKICTNGGPVRNLSITIESSFDVAWRSRAESKQDPEGIGVTRADFEAWMLYEFKREAHNYLTELPQPKDLLEWLALARHYGMPCRLLDFTYSFYVASYFALSGKDKPGVVLAINLSWLKKDLENKLEAGRKQKNKNKNKNNWNPPVRAKKEWYFQNPEMFGSDPLATVYPPF